MGKHSAGPDDRSGAADDACGEVPVVFDEAFVRGGRYEPPARTRSAIAQYADRDTSWRHPVSPVVRPSPPLAPRSRRVRPGRLLAARPAGQPDRSDRPDRSDHAVSPLFVALLAAFLLSLAVCWESGARVAVFAVVLLGWLVSLCLHEFAHARVAYAGGDRSVAVRGYLSLDPRRYAHPVLSYLLPVLWVVAGGIGLPGGAVWVDRGAVRGRWRRSLISLAGPATNALCAGLCLGAVGAAARSGGGLPGHAAFWAALAFLGFLQLSATVVNLLPIPGLDGWGVLEPHLPAAAVAAGRAIAPFGAVVALLLLFRSGTVSGAAGRGLEHVGSLAGVPPVLVALGAQLFRFWH